MHRFLESLLTRCLTRTEQRRKRLWKSLREEFEKKRDLSAEIKRRYPQLAFAAPGHFYSPLPNIPEAVAYRQNLRAPDSPEFAGLDMRGAHQLSLVKEMSAFFDEFDTTITDVQGRRYSGANDQYGSGDAVMLYAMVRHFRPRRIMEIGSGHSSALLLDINDIAGGPRVELTFIEPYPDRLKNLTRGCDPSSFTLVEQPVQAVDPTLFEALDDGDFLFVDCSHVSKVGSDLNHIVFEILPRLKPGVFVHFHDMFYPFEYPEAWIREGRAWNEIYLVRAFLSWNESWSVELFGQCLGAHFWDQLPTGLAKHGCGGYLWMRRVK